MNIKKRISIRAKVIIAIAITFIIPVIVIMTLEYYYFFGRRVEEEGKKALNLTRELYLDRTEEGTKKMASTLRALSGDEKMKELFMQKEKNELFYVCYPTFLELNNDFGISQWYFIEKEPDSTCFLRLHHYPKSGDRIERYTYRQAVETKELSSGIELGDNIFALRVVQPYYHDEELIGYMELAEEIDDIIYLIKKETGYDASFFVRKELIGREGWESVKGINLTEESWNSLDGYVSIYQTSGITSEDSIDIAEIGDDGMTLGFFHDGERKVTKALFPVYDAGENKIGAILVSVDITVPYRNFHRRLYTNIGLLFASMAILGFILFFIIRNINKDLRLARLEAERSARRAKNADKAKSSFLANMSHEIRTPMNAILGFSEMLREKVEKPELKKYTDTIISSGKTLLGLINDILDLSKIEAGRMEIQKNPVNPKALFNDIAKVFSVKLEQKGLKLLKEVDDGLPKSILIDEVRVRQILFNLVGNSVKFTSEGYVELKVKGRFYEDKSKIDLVFSVKDTGIGISEEDQKKIFESFSQSKGQDTKKYGGTGLGLSITKKLIQLMNGEIDVESTVGKGSKFTVILKEISVASLSERPEKDSKNNIETIRFKGQKVLIVDDIESNRLLLKETLPLYNLKTMEASNGREAVFMTINHKPDIILMDLRMPVMDGYEAVHKIKTDDNLKDIPVIVLTASAMKDEVEKIKKVKNDGYIRKPISRDELIKELSKFLDHEKAEKRSGQKEKEEDKPKASEKDISRFDRKNLGKIIKIIDEEMTPEWERVKKESIIEDIEEFADKISRFSSKYGLTGLLEWSENIEKQAGDFDLDNLDDTLERYKQIVKNIKEKQDG